MKVACTFQNRCIPRLDRQGSDVRNDFWPSLEYNEQHSDRSRHSLQLKAIIKAGFQSNSANWTDATPPETLPQSHGCRSGKIYGEVWQRIRWKILEAENYLTGIFKIAHVQDAFHHILPFTFPPKIQPFQDTLTELAVCSCFTGYL